MSEYEYQRRLQILEWLCSGALTLTSDRRLIWTEDGRQLVAPTDYRSILEAAGYFGYDPSNHVGRRL